MMKLLRIEQNNTNLLASCDGLFISKVEQYPGYDSVHIKQITYSGSSILNINNHIIIQDEALPIITLIKTL